jgi:maltose-binding protein MalE
MKRVSGVILLVLLAAAVASCLRQSPPTDVLRGRLLVWHTWPEPYSAQLEASLETFSQVNPDVLVMSEYVDAARLEARFLDQTAAGLGPDLILGTTPTVVSLLADKGLLADLAPRIDPDAWPLYGLDALRVDDALHAVPVAASTKVLFYNSRYTDTVPLTLDDLITLARADQIAVLAADFEHSFWGIDAHGGEVSFQGGRPAVTAGLAEWLTWLQRAQKEPNIVITSDAVEAYELFADGFAAYFVGQSTLLPHLRERLGEANVGVALLPGALAETDTAGDSATTQTERLSGASGPPGSFLDLQLGVVSSVSTQDRLALALLGFITNPVQQRELAVSGLGYAPLNRRVRFDVRIPHAEAVIVRQSSIAAVVPLRDIPAFEQLLAIADDGFAQVLGGVVEPEEGARVIQQQLRQPPQLARNDDN